MVLFFMMRKTHSIKNKKILKQAEKMLLVCTTGGEAYLCTNIL